MQTQYVHWDRSEPPLNVYTPCELAGTLNCPNLASVGLGYFGQPIAKEIVTGNNKSVYNILYVGRDETASGGSLSGCAADSSCNSLGTIPSEFGLPAKCQNQYGNPNIYFVGKIYDKTTYEWRCSQSSTCAYNITPQAQETCGDLKDNNCNGQVDEGCPVCVDNDGDGHYAISGNCPQGDDCNDNDATVYPGAPELCGDSIDNNCNGQIDEGFDVGASCTVGVGACQRTGTKVCSADHLSTVCNATPGTPATEICGNNIDGSTTDESCKGVPDAGCKFDGTNTCLSSSLNMASSNLEHSQTLFRTQGSILPIVFELTYNSLDNDGVFGKGWSHPYNIKLIQQSSTEYTLIQSYGKHMTLIQNGSQYKPPTEAYPVLIKNPDNTYKLTYRDNTVYNFDTTGKLTSIQDRNLNAITFAYTGSNLTSITDVAGRVTTLTYNASNKISTITDPKGNTHTFTYTNNFLTGITTQTTDSITKSWAYTYDTSGYMLTKTDPMGYISSYAYDSNHKLTSSTDPEGKTRTPAFDPLNTTSTITERDSGLWTYKYNTTFGSITEKTDPDGNKTTYAYDANGNNTAITDPKLNTTTYAYDTNGNVLTETDPAGKTTTYTYNSLNQILTITDPLNNITSFTYDSKGNRLSMTDPTGAATSYTYDTKGNITSITNPLNQTTTLVYDTSNNLTSITDHTSAVTSFTYDTSGNILTKTDPNGNITTYEYNGLNQLKKITDHLGNITTIINDLKGNITSITDPLGHTTTYEYNYKGQLKKITDSLGNITQYAYGGTGCPSCGRGGDNLVSMTDARGKITTFEYDKRGNRLKQTSPTGKIINLAYDSTNLLTSLTDPSSAVTTFAYDNRSLLTTKTDPLSAVTTFTYDNAGRPASKRDRKLDTINYAYTADSKISTITYPNASTTTFTYDTLDRVLTMQDSLGLTTYAYDDINRIVTITDANGFVVIHKYDAIGNLIELTYPGNKKVTYTYDSLNRLKTVTNWLNQVATYNYDNAGRLTSLTNFNSTTTTYGYDNANRLTSLLNKKSDASVIATYSYTLNAVGNITRSVQDEPLEPVFTAGTTNYTYNAQKTRLLSAGADTFTYDNEGQLATGYGSSYAFDYEHRLTAISGAFSATYFYDGFGNRLKAIRSGVVTKYIYDVNGNVIAEADSSNNITRYYVHGIGLMSLITPSDSVYIYHFNNIGSTIAITDETQTIANKYSYDPFGVVLNQVEAVPQPFKYVGQYGVMREPNGIDKMGYRYYDPNGVFLSEDPLGFGGGDVNLRRYTANDPLSFIDPYGLIRWPKVIQGGSEVAVAGIMFGGAITTGSTGLGAPAAITLGLSAGALIGHGFTTMIAGFGNSDAPVIQPHPVAIGTYICTKDLDKAERNMLLFDLLRGGTSLMWQQGKWEKLTNYEKTKILLEFSNNQYSIQYEIWKKNKQKK